MVLTKLVHALHHIHMPKENMPPQPEFNFEGGFEGIEKAIAKPEVAPITPEEQVKVAAAHNIIGEAILKISKDANGAYLLYGIPIENVDKLYEGNDNSDMYNHMT